MADEEHLRMLKQGAKVWNAWLAENPGVWPDLSGAHLRGADLEGADLSGADIARANLREANLIEVHLRGADLERADLSGADIRRADLSIANLRGANIVEADLRVTNLSGADLRKANLREALVGNTNLNEANLSEAKLSGASLREADLSETIFGDVDLTKTKGLKRCRHTGPCIVDHRTLERSKGVPIEFWRGCGLPDWQIEAAKLYQPGLTQGDVHDIGYEIIRVRAEQPIQLFSPFISYSSKDAAFAKRLYDSLQGNGVRCWFAPEDMKIGDRIRLRIDEVIHVHDKLLLVLSENSVDSPWVEQEVETALEKERETGETVLFPIKVDNAVDGMKVGWPALVRKTRHIGDFTRWKDHDAYKATFERILRDLRAER